MFQLHIHHPARPSPDPLALFPPYLPSSCTSSLLSLSSFRSLSLGTVEWLWSCAASGGERESLWLISCPYPNSSSSHQLAGSEEENRAGINSNYQLLHVKDTLIPLLTASNNNTHPKTELQIYRSCFFHTQYNDRQYGRNVLQWILFFQGKLQNHYVITWKHIMSLMLW